MATAPGYFDKKPSSPYTPKASYTRSGSSGNAGFRGEEEPIVFEFGARHFSAGFPGESAPRCTLGFGPEESRTVGDYRLWQPPFGKDPVRKREGYEWGEDHELWRMDVRELDLGLVEDKIERAVREAYTQHLLLDFVPRRLTLLLPSVIAHPLLSTVLTTLFQQCNFRTITLLSTPFACVLAAGCRSGLVLDIGWSETTVTAIYEYREVYHCKTTRAMKQLTLEMAKLIYSREAGASEARHGPEEGITNFAVEDFFTNYEEIATRMAWCRGINEVVNISPEIAQDLPQMDQLSIAEEGGKDPLMEIPSPIPPRHVNIPFSHLARPADTAFFATGSIMHESDDEEQPLHTLAHNALLRLPPDVRGTCMSRIIITGGGSHIPGLKTRLLDEIARLVRDRSWDPVRGKAADERRKRLREISINRPSPPHAHPPDATAAALAPPIPDPIHEKLQREQSKDSKPTVAGVVRGVETLGAWAGGSLATGLKIKSTVEIERDSFLLHGLAGARRDAEPSVVPQRLSYGAGVPRAGTGEKGPWSLGGWA